MPVNKQPVNEQLPVSQTKKVWRRRFLLLMTAMVFSAFMAEAVLRIARPGFPGFRIPQIEHRPAPGIGFEMIPNQQGYTFAEQATINAGGLRNPEIQDRLAIDLRVVCLGDSITFGVGVGDDIPYPRQLEALLKNKSSGDERPEKTIEVINCGVQRYSTYQEMDYFREAVKVLKPDIVTLGVYFNDLSIRPEGDYTREYENEREQVASSFRKQVPWLYLLAKKSATIELSKQVYLGRSHRNRTLRRLTSGPTEKEEKKWAAMAEELKTFQKLSEEYGFRPLVVTIPARIQVQRTFPDSRFPARVLEICSDLKLPVESVHKPFIASLKKGADPYLDWDDHMSETGHRIVAEVIGQHFSE